MEIASRDCAVEFDLSALNFRWPLPVWPDADDVDRRLALEVRAELWSGGPAGDFDISAYAMFQGVKAIGADPENPEVRELANRLSAILRADLTIGGPPSPQAARWVGRVFEDEQRQDLLVVAAGQYLAGTLKESGGKLFVRLRELDRMGLPDADVAMVAQALMRRIAVAKSENWVGEMDPIVGYGFAFRREWCDAARYLEDETTVAVATPGLMRLRIIGDWYELGCDLWPCDVTMKASDFLRARSSAREIFKQTGIQPDSPAGRWRQVWEIAGLRDRLIQVADRENPSDRQARIVTWLGTIEGAAPAADRSRPDGSAARLPDGAVVASMAWLVNQAIGDAIARESEREAVQAVIRANTGESIRKTDGSRSIRLRLLPAKSPLSIEALDCEK
jgi:hypothetical protein